MSIHDYKTRKGDDSSDFEAYVSSAIRRFLIALAAFILIAIIMMLCSCRSPQTVVIELKDSIRTEIRTETVYDTDTQYVTLPPQIAEIITIDTTSTLETDYAISTASITQGQLHHRLSNKTTPIPVEVQHQETSTTTTTHETHQVPVTPQPQIVEKEVPAQLSWWQQTRLHIADVVLIVLGIYVAVWLFRKRKTCIAWILKLIS